MVAHVHSQRSLRGSHVFDWGLVGTGAVCITFEIAIQKESGAFPIEGARRRSERVARASEFMVYRPLFTAQVRLLFGVPRSDVGSTTM